MIPSLYEDLGTRVIEILQTNLPHEKARLAILLSKDWTAVHQSQSAAMQALPPLPPLTPPESPGRPAQPPLVPPTQVPRRRIGSLTGRIGLLHALSHIELNAIDLAVDLLARFGHECPTDLQPDFVEDWLSVCADEAQHFLMLADRLTDLGSYYGALPAHSGLWDVAQKTAGDVMARLAIAPLVLEARGLDVTPDMITKLEKNGDQQSANILQNIYQDEIDHVRIGHKWFQIFCRLNGQCGKAAFQNYVATYFPAGLKAPFNHEARAKAGFDAGYYASFD